MRNRVLNTSNFPLYGIQCMLTSERETGRIEEGGKRRVVSQQIYIFLHPEENENSKTATVKLTGKANLLSRLCRSSLTSLWERSAKTHRATARPPMWTVLTVKCSEMKHRGSSNSGRLYCITVIASVFFIFKWKVVTFLHTHTIVKDLRHLVRTD